MLSRLTRITASSLSEMNCSKSNFNQDMNKVLNHTNHNRFNFNQDMNKLLHHTNLFKTDLIKSNQFYRYRYIHISSDKSYTKNNEHSSIKSPESVLSMYFNKVNFINMSKFIVFPVYVGTVAGFLFGMGIIFIAALQEDVGKVLILSPFILGMFTVFGSIMGAMWFVSVPLLLIQLLKSVIC